MKRRKPKTERKDEVIRLRVSRTEADSDTGRESRRLGIVGMASVAGVARSEPGYLVFDAVTEGMRPLSVIRAADSALGFAFYMIQRH